MWVETLLVALLPDDNKLVGRSAEALTVALGPEGMEGIHSSDLHYSRYEPGQ